MKKILLITLLIIFIPYIVVSIFIKTDRINFKNMSNYDIRVKIDSSIIIIPFEEYIVGVLAGEMPSSFELEALKAQAVAARSYAMKQIEKNKKNEFDVVNTTDNQVYYTDEQLKGKWQTQYNEKISKIKKAVLDTKGEYLTYNGEIVEAFFFSTSNGKTENSEDVFVKKLPYLRSVSSIWDENSPSYQTDVSFSKDEFLNKLELSANNNIDTTILETTNTGRIKKIKINEKIFTGREIATKLLLKSSSFQIQISDKVYIHVKGYGHGVGLSQYGALGMAKEGYTYDKILKHYYTDVQIQK